MRRIANATGISPKMYRHFAAVTVGITGMLALFADGESREAVAAQIAKQGEAAAERREDMRKAGNSTFTRPLKSPGSYSEGSFDYSDTGGGGSYGAPMDGASGEGASAGFVPDEFGTKKRSAPASYAKFGLTQEQWEALSEEERKRIREAALNRKSASQLQREAEALKIASRNRANR